MVAFGEGINSTNKPIYFSNSSCEDRLYLAEKELAGRKDRLEKLGGEGKEIHWGVNGYVIAVCSEEWMEALAETRRKRFFETTKRFFPIWC